MAWDLCTAGDCLHLAVSACSCSIHACEAVLVRGAAPLPPLLKLNIIACYDYLFWLLMLLTWLVALLLCLHLHILCVVAYLLIAQPLLCIFFLYMFW